MKSTSFKLSALAVMVAAGLAACGGSSNSAPVAEDVTVAEANEWEAVTGTLPVSDADGDELEITVFNSNGMAVSRNDDGDYEFSHGILSVNLEAQTFSYTALDSSAAENGVAIDYEISDGSLTDSATIRIEHVNGDPLASQQWHLRNTGQAAFSMQPQTLEAYAEYYVAAFGLSEEEAAELFASFDERYRVPGEDLNVVGALRQGYTGEGSIAVVVDSGMAVNHEDLVDNVLPGRSVNFGPVSDRTDTTLEGTGGDHGTSVAGLIAATGWNGIGGRGVAPNASLIGMNYLEYQSERNEMMAYGMAGSGISPSDNVVVFNRSYGTSAPLFFNTDEITETMHKYPTENLRNGLGALNIKSAGNGFARSGFAEGQQLCDLAQEGLSETSSIVLSCNDVNWDTGNASFYTVSIGALTSYGGMSSYSTAGSAVFVSAPAGEDGALEPAMITTDQTTCTRGYSGWGAYDSFMNVNGSFFASLGIDDFHERVYPFNSPMGELNPTENAGCNYTNTFNGTSSAAPNVAGVVALIAEANPDLSWREIRHVLAESAEPVWAQDAPVELEVGDGSFTAHYGWIVNGAGYPYNNKFGFGRPDAGLAVELASSASLPELVETDWVELELAEPVAIPDNDADGVSLTIEMAEALTIEGMQFGFDVYSEDLVNTYMGMQSGSTAASDIAIEVTSPAGTTAVLATSRTAIGSVQGLGNASFLGYAYAVEAPILANAFYGESSEGTWTVRFVDTNGADLGPFLNNSSDSLVAAAQVRVFGH